MNHVFYHKGGNYTLYVFSVYFCTFLACLVPRYIHTFKITNAISMYTIAVIVVWLIFSRQIRVSSNIDSLYYGSLFFLVMFSFGRVETFGVWILYVSWTIITILFKQIIILKPIRITFETIIIAITHAVFIQLMIGLYEVFSHRYVFEIGNVGRRLYGNVAISMFYNLNDYATFVVTLFPFVIYRYFKQNTLTGKVIHLFFVLVSIFLVGCSESRGAYLSLITLIGTLIFLYWRKAESRKASVMCLGLIGAILFFFLSTFFFGAFDRLVVSIFADKSSVTSDITRFNLIKNGFYFLEMTNGLGVGAGNLYYYFANFSIYQTSIRFMHNWYMEILATFGVPFFILYLVFHINIIVRLLKNHHKSNDLWDINNTILMTFMAFSVVSISSSSLIYSEWVWMYLAFISTYVTFECKSGNNYAV